MKKDKSVIAKDKMLHMERLEKLGYSNSLYAPYKPSQIQQNILRWFKTHSAMHIAKKLKVDKSYVYAVVDKFKNIYTIEELRATPITTKSEGKE